MLISSDSFTIEVSLNELLLLSSAVHRRLWQLKTDTSDDTVGYFPLIDDYRKLEDVFNKILEPIVLNDDFKSVPL